MKSTERLSGEERRAAIIKAVRRTFAEKGFHGTTTRELAAAAGVSEALLFKHFPTKEALYSAMRLACCGQQNNPQVERLRALEPSASTLVLMVHFLVSRVLGGCGRSNEEERAVQNRLMLRSLAEDGEFARLLLRKLAEGWVPKVAQCLEAAAAAGEVVDGHVHPALGAWFAHHLAAILMVYLLPETPVVDYPVPRDQLVEQVVWFSLRGMGLKEEAIRRYYNPTALALLAD
ncbi:MAG TPA: helix-turn-helix domain-containing protein [Gemmataceae bacterium]|nr:helix-turn-helix domain-containing protein [Gemmataceae bacterium]